MGFDWAGGGTTAAQVSYQARDITALLCPVRHDSQPSFSKGNQMNPLQKAAFEDGWTWIAKAFQSGDGLNLARFEATINEALSGDASLASRVQVVDRNEEGDIEKTTTFEARRNEAAGYRLLGAFNAVESIRTKLATKGVTFTASIKT
jgi:hypothetical protein